MRRLFCRVRPWLALAAVVLSLSVAVPPVGTYARQYAFAQAARLLPFLALVITWRLPAVLGALARHPALTAAELVTLVGSGVILWLGLAPRPGSPPTLSRPLRAGMATVAVWTIWAIAYITGMSRIAVAAAR